MVEAFPQGHIRNENKKQGLHFLHLFGGLVRNFSKNQVIGPHCLLFKSGALVNRSH